MGNFSSPLLDSIDIKNEINFNYEEVFLTNKVMYIFSKNSGFAPPYNYLIKKDSLFICVGIDCNNFQFRGKIKIIDVNQFILIDSLNRKGIFNRILNVENTLNKHIIFNSKYPDFHQENTDFTQGFLDRSEEYYKKRK